MDWYHARPGLLKPSSYFIPFYRTKGALSYMAQTKRDMPKDAVDVGEFQGQSCQYELAIPLSLSISATKLSVVFGNGSYEKTLRKIMRAHPHLRGLWDIRADQHSFGILGIFLKFCMRVSARGYIHADDTPPPNPSIPQPKR